MSKGKLLAICIIWLTIVGIGAVAWRMIVVPSVEKAEEEEKGNLIRDTRGESPYRQTVDIALDQFSGYAVLRSSRFEEALRGRGLRLNLIDDQADYAKRLQSLRDGKTDMAAFTIDALIKSSAQLNDVPAVIVSLIDETRGADAIVAYKTRYPNVDAMNNPETRFVLTPDSPSETLARVIMMHFNLDRLAENPFVMTTGPEETYQRYQAADASSPEVFVTWEPFVSRMIENDSMHVVVDSSRVRGYILDVLVANRDFLQKNARSVETVLEAYFTAAYEYRKDMESLVAADAKQSRQNLTPEQVANLVGGIHWKNTMENFAHFGLLGDMNVGHIDDMVTRISKLMLETGAIAQDPTRGSPELLYNQKPLAALQAARFHPGIDPEQVMSDEVQLPTLTEDEWQRLREVGELNVGTLVFAPGTSRLSDLSFSVLDELAESLKTWPQYYVLVRGNASKRGDLKQNRMLAEERAQAAADYLIGKGIDRSRIRAVGAEPSGQTSVVFVVGEAPY